MTKKPAVDKSEQLLSEQSTSEQVKALQSRLFEAAAGIDEGNAIVFDCRGPANPYEKMYDRHGLNPNRPRR